jgi:hypothetical protein
VGTVVVDEVFKVSEEGRQGAGGTGPPSAAHQAAQRIKTSRVGQPRIDPISKRTGAAARQHAYRRRQRARP